MSLTQTRVFVRKTYSLKLNESSQQEQLGRSLKEIPNFEDATLIRRD